MDKEHIKHITETGFRAPDHYFDKFEDDVMHAIQQSNLPNKTGFKVPEDYFTQLEEGVITAVNNTKPAPKVISLRKAMYYASAIAAAIMLYFSFYNPVSRNEDLTLEMVEDYFDYKYIDSYELAELLIESELLEVEDLSLTTDYNNNDIENYLLEHADIEEFMTQ